MSFRDLIREAARSLGANRARSALTILGIVIGIAAVISMTSLIGGVQDMLISSLGLNAARLVNVYSGPAVDRTVADRVALSVPSVERVEGSVSSYATVQGEKGEVSVGVTGADPALFEMTGQLHISQGRMFTDEEAESGARVAVIGSSGVRLLFGNPDADVLGRTIRLNGRDYRIVGVSEDAGVDMGDYFNAYLGLKTVQDDFLGGSDALESLYALAYDGEDVEVVASQVKDALATILGLSAEEAEEQIWTSTMKAVIDEMNTFMGSFQLIMGAVAGVSLLVGGIGIMNMMLTNVTERIREIGVRRALGATRRDITLQFLCESGAICLLGGLVGMVLGYALAWGLSLAGNAMGIADQLGSGMGGSAAGALAPSFSAFTVLFSVLVSVGIGLIFGYYPARRAARMDPVECLRYQ